MSERSQIRRLPERSVDDRATIDAILDEGFVCHAGYVTEGRPVVIPTLYTRGSEPAHGSNSMGLTRAVRAGSPLLVSVTIVDGIVVARSAFNSSANYRSVVVHGQARLLQGAEKREALDLIIDQLIPGRLADVRESTDAEIGQTSVIELDLDEVSAKVRTGDPEDDPEDMSLEVWAGVVPLSLVAGDPIPAEGLGPEIDTPEYLRRFRR
jgi:nitroimidazol reductase NimA-like FMN-containing flavoprotein (pyridoxamine 5'-phosphate oxidase superfamily)